MIIIPIILFLIPIAIKLKHDFGLWKKDDPVNHNHEFWIVVACEVPAGFSFFALYDGHMKTIFLILTITGLMGFWFLFLFDGFYNLVRKWYAKRSGWRLLRGQYDFFYRGSDDLDDATTDNIFQRMKQWQHIAIKIGGIILFTYLYFR